MDTSVEGSQDLNTPLSRFLNSIPDLRFVTGIIGEHLKMRRWAENRFFMLSDSTAAALGGA
jgi:hypothetical protein